MPLTIIGACHANVLDVDPHVIERITGTIVFGGGDNTLRIEAPFNAASFSAHLGGGASVHIGAGCSAGHLEVHNLRGGTVKVGAGCAFNGHVRLLVHERSRITFGAKCLVAADVVVTASDMHSLLERRTGVRLNPAAHVVIGDKVWIGFRAFVGKGARIGEGSVIGAGAVVTGSIPAHAMAAGVPARVLKHEVDWTFDLV